MAFHILDEVRKKPRSEWQGFLRDKWANTRIWIQENGEAAFVLGLLLGLGVVIFHKLFIAIIAVGVIVGGVLYAIAPEQAAYESDSELSGQSAGESNATSPVEKTSEDKQGKQGDEEVTSSGNGAIEGEGANSSNGSDQPSA